MSLISQLNNKNIKEFSDKELNALCEEIRQEIITVTRNNGGHLSSNLGIIETTVALHRVFNFPTDKLIFDVGHQCYTHKILSGRAEQFSTIRCDGGLSGFPDSDESAYDAFSVGHAGTSISAGLGYCNARDNLKEDYFVVNVVGDGSLVNGMNLEAMFSSPEKPKKFIVVLNDNGMSISKNGNGFYRLISQGTTKKGYVTGKKAIKKVFGNSFVTRWLISIRDFIKRAFNKRGYFEQFGFKYVELKHGNDVDKLVTAFENIKNTAETKALFVHVHTTKGKGLKEAEERADFYHGVGKRGTVKQKSFAGEVGKKLNQLIENDKKIVTVTAGMKDGTGLSAVEKEHPENFIDVGIAEEYAVTLSAGMAKGGLKPIVAIYSTFLQRAYDQILHDVCLQNLPVVFLIDRAGLNGEDGKTHQGVFDLSYFNHIPNITVLAPATAEELNHALDYALTLNAPVAIRYPKSDCGIELEYCGEFGKYQTVVDGEVPILAVGPDMLCTAVKVAEQFKGKVKVVNARRVKPLDKEFLDSVTGGTVITLEDNSVLGGFGWAVNAHYAQSNVKVINLGVKDEFIVHGSRANQLKYNGLDYNGIYQAVEKVIKEKV